MNTKLTKELQELIMKNFRKVKIIPMSTGSMWGADLTDMLLLLQYNKGILILLCFKFSKYILYSKYAGLVFYKKASNSKKKKKEILMKYGMKTVYIDKLPDIVKQYCNDDLV